MNDLIIRVGQLQSDIRSSIDKIYEPTTRQKFENVSALNVEINNLNQKADAIKQLITKMNADITALRYLINSSGNLDNVNTVRR